MKFSILLTFTLITVSCGKIETAGTSGVGGVMELQPQTITASDDTIFDSICAAMLVKSDKLSSALPNSLIFDVVEKDCDGKTVTFNAQQVRVEPVGADYQFRRMDNSLFVFPTVETKTSGLLSDICGGRTSLPLEPSTGQAVWIYTSGFDTANCPSAANEQCLLVRHGSKQGTTNSYLIHKEEFVRFNLAPTSGKYGYFTHRKSFATNNCDQGKNTESSATLR